MSALAYKNLVSCLFAFQLLSITSSVAQDQNASHDSYNRGLDAISKSIQAMGGFKAMDTAGYVSFSLKGIYYPFNQSYSPTIKPDSLELETKVVYRATTTGFSVDQKIYMPDKRYYTLED